MTGIENATVAEPAALPALLLLLDRVRNVGNRAELDFIAVNNTHLLAQYTQAVLWTRHAGAIALSGVSTVERNAPYVQWVGKICELCPQDRVRRLAIDDFPLDLSAQWGEWLPISTLWVPFSIASDRGPEIGRAHV